MYMRLVRVTVKPGDRELMRHHYNSSVIPLLQKTDGCLFAGLIRRELNADEYISLTLWDNREHAEEYVRSGKFEALMKEASIYLVESSEWRIHLSDDQQLVYDPVPEQPKVEEFQIGSGPERLGVPAGDTVFIRIVSLQIQGDMADQFKHLYQGEILPRLREAEGCRFAGLSEQIGGDHRFLSISVWDSREFAERYERSGLFDALLDKVKHTFSDVYQWKMQLEKVVGSQVVTSEEIAVDGYVVESGKQFF